MSRPDKFFDYPEGSRPHFERCWGTPQENIEYCEKEGDWTEQGERPWTQEERGAVGGQAERDRWDTAREMAMEGNFEAIPSSIYIPYLTNLEKINNNHMVSPKNLDGPLKNIWLWGPTGVGKSTTVAAKYPEAYRKPLTKWWPGYNNDKPGHSVVLLEEVDPGWKEKRDLKVWSGS